MERLSHIAHVLPYLATTVYPGVVEDQLHWSILVTQSLLGRIALRDAFNHCAQLPG